MQPIYIYIYTVYIIFLVILLLTMSSARGVHTAFMCVPLLVVSGGAVSRHIFYAALLAGVDRRPCGVEVASENHPSRPSAFRTHFVVLLTSMYDMCVAPLSFVAPGRRGVGSSETPVKSSERFTLSSDIIHTAVLWIDT